MISKSVLGLFVPCQVLAVSGAVIKADLPEGSSVAERQAHKIFPPWPWWTTTTKMPPIFTIPRFTLWPWPRPWPWPKPGPWPCLSCPEPGVLDKVKEKINPLIKLNGGLMGKIRQDIGAAGKIILFKNKAVILRLIFS